MPLGQELTQQINKIVESLKAYEPERIILFGSAVRDDFDEYSDLDIVIIKKTDKRFVERLVEVVEFLGPDLPHADIFVYTPEEFERMKEEENPFIEQVLKSGKIVYEKL
jgi:predicted nucleotidyltransferase